MFYGKSRWSKRLNFQPLVVFNNINLLNLICCFEIKWLANAAVVSFSFESFNVIYQMLIQITKNRTLMTIILEENKIIDPYAKFTLSSEN